MEIQFLRLVTITGSSVNSFLKNVATQGEGYAYSSSSDLSGIYENIERNEIVTRYETIIKMGLSMIQ